MSKRLNLRNEIICLLGCITVSLTPVGSEVWRRNDIIHRDDGPAVSIQGTNLRFWYVGGRSQSPDLNWVDNQPGLG